MLDKPSMNIDMRAMSPSARYKGSPKFALYQLFARAKKASVQPITQVTEPSLHNTPTPPTRPKKHASILMSMPRTYLTNSFHFSSELKRRHTRSDKASLHVIIYATEAD